MTTYADFLDREVFSTVGRTADELGMPCYVVGGFVRDKFLGRPIKMDLDFVTVGSGIELAKAVQKKLSPKDHTSTAKVISRRRYRIYNINNLY